MPIELNGFSPSHSTPSGEAAPARPDRKDAETRDAGNQAAGGSDTVRLTGAAERLRHLEESLAALPVVDEKRVEAMRQAIAGGAYRADASRVADKLLAFEQNLSGPK